MAESMKSRKSLLFNAWTTLALLFLIGVVANLASQDVFVRLDLTADRSFTLGPASRELLDKLQDELTVRVYFADALAPPYHEHARKLRDKLEEYQAHAGGKIEIVWKDPGADPAIEEEARRFGIQSSQLQVRDRSKVELRKVYMGAALVYRDRQEVLPFLADLSTLDFDISRSVKSLIEGGEKKTVGFLTGHGEPDLAAGQGQLQSIKAKIEETYRLVSVKLGEGKGVPEEVDALVVLGARQPLSDREKFEIDQYAMRGGPVAFFVTQISPDMRQLRVQKSKSGVEDLLATYGVTVQPGTVIDREQMGVMPMPVRRGPFTMQARVSTPLIPLATRFSEDSLLTKGMKALPLPFASPLQVQEAARKDGREATELAWTSESSVTVPRVASLDPSTLKEPGPDEEPGPFTVGVALKGSFPSAWAGKEPPEAAAAAPGPGETELTELLGGKGGGASDDAIAARAPDGSRMLVFGASDFVLGSLDFLQASLDWLVLDDTLLAIRPKQAMSPLLKETTEGQRAAIKLGNLLGPSGLLILYGAWRARRRARG